MKLAGEGADPRWAAAAVAVCGFAVAYLTGGVIDDRLRAAVGAVTLIALVAAASRDLRRVAWRTVGWGIALQVLFALFILRFEIAGVRPGYALFSAIAEGARRFLEFSGAGALFVFGPLADPEALGAVLPSGFVFAFTALPAIIFISSFFTVLYYLGVLQVLVGLMARAMVHVMGTSGAETLSAAANVFMGQTEAPIIVRPYISGMTQSELLALMVGGLATISGSVMAVYIGLGGDAIAILTTSVMAAPCGLYLAKILWPETGEPATRGGVRIVVEREHVNVVDAAASGASQGITLALNVAAVLIAFLAFLAMIDYLLGLAVEGLSLAALFGWIFAPVAMLLGAPLADVPELADLLGTKLVATEFVAYVKLTTEYRETLDPRTYVLAAYALTGFANFGSIGIILGGVGALAPDRRQDLARLGGRALLGGFVATLVNTCVAAMLI